MKRRPTAAFAVLAMLAATVAPVHAFAMAGNAPGAGADLCAAGADRGQGPGAPGDDRRHACDRCDGCPGAGAALPPAIATLHEAHRIAGRRLPPPAIVLRPNAARAAPFARGPPTPG